MGNTTILTKNHPAELGTVAQAEAFQISLLGGPDGEQRLKEQHGWWNEAEQKAEWLVTTLEPETPYSFEEAQKVYYAQVLSRVQQGFVHSRSYSFKEGKFVYRDLKAFKLEKAANV
ncbi:MAG: hypothetical protein WA192_05590 [Candidatus Acidiferrales bacterium]